MPAASSRRWSGNDRDRREAGAGKSRFSGHRAGPAVLRKARFPAGKRAGISQNSGAPVVKWVDIPPVWLLGMLALAWAQATYLPAGLGFGGAWADFAGGLLVGGGLVLALLAIHELRRHRTTPLPHQEPERLVTTGIFSRSRNPIYLGDLLILAGLILRWDAVLSLPLLPVFLWVLERRFVLPEEDRLRRRFRLDYARYCTKARRWV